MQHLNGILGDDDLRKDINNYWISSGTTSMVEADRELILEKEFDLRSMDPRFDCKTGYVFLIS